MDIFRLREMGYSISGISRETGKDRKTVRKYLNQGKSKSPAMKKCLPKDSKLDPIKSYIHSLLKGLRKRIPTMYSHL